MKPTPDRSLWRGVAFAMPIAIMLWTSIVLAVRSCTLLAPTFQSFEQPDTAYHPGPAYYLHAPRIEQNAEFTDIDRGAWTCVYYPWIVRFGSAAIIYSPPWPCSPDLPFGSSSGPLQGWICEPNDSAAACDARRPPPLDDARYLVPEAKRKQIERL